MSTLTISLIVFLFMIISFSMNKIPMALTSMICMVVLVITGCIDGTTAIGTFGSSTVITIVSMFIVAEGLNRTQMVNHLSKMVYKVTKGSFTKVLAGYVIVTFILGQFIPSIVALFALVSPLVLNMCDEINVNPSKMMYSIGLVIVSTSFTLLPIGPYAATFIEDNGYLASFGHTATQMTIWSETICKIPVSIAILIWAIFFAPKFAPDTPDFPIKTVDRKNKTGKDALNPNQEIIAYVTFIVVIAGLMFGSKIGISSWLVSMIGACVLVLFKVLNEKDAIRSMNLDIIMLYVGVLVLGKSLVATGAGDVIGNFFAGMLGSTRNGYLIGAVFFLAAFVLTSVLYNRAVSKILTPLAIMTCVSLGCDPRGPLILCYMGSMASIITPMSTAVVPMMMGTGGYNQKTLFKMSIIPSVIQGVIGVLVTMTFFPAF